MNKDLGCPKCETSSLRRPQGDATSVWRCYQCHGMWLSSAEAETLIEEGTLLDPQSLLPQKAPADHKAALCPMGHGFLTRARVELSETVLSGALRPLHRHLV